MVAVFALCEFSSLFTFPTDSRVRNMLCDQFMEFTEPTVGGRHKAQQCCGKGRLRIVVMMSSSIHKRDLYAKTATPQWLKRTSCCT